MLSIFVANLWVNTFLRSLAGNQSLCKHRVFCVSLQEFLDKQTEVADQQMGSSEYNNKSDLSEDESGDNSALNLDMDKFVKEMQRALDLGGTGEGSSDEGSSFYGEYGEEDNGINPPEGSFTSSHTFQS